MCPAVEAIPIRLRVVHPNVCRGRHSLDIRRTVVAPVEIDVMTVSPFLVLVDSVAEVPFIGESMRRIQVPVDGLVDHLVAPSNVPIEGHQGVPRPKVRSSSHATVPAEKEMVRRGAYALSVVEGYLNQGISADKAGSIEQADDEPPVCPDAV